MTNTNNPGRRCTCGAEIEHVCGMGACYDICPRCGFVNLSDAERELWRIEQRIVTNAAMLFLLVIFIIVTLAILLIPTPADSRKLRHPPAPPPRPADLGRSVPIDALKKEPVLPVPDRFVEPPLHCRIFPIVPGCP